MEHRKLPRPGWKLVKSWLKAKLLVRSIFGICISLFFFCFLEIYVQQVVYVLRRTGSDKLPLGVIMLIESSRS